MKVNRKRLLALVCLSITLVLLSPTMISLAPMPTGPYIAVSPSSVKPGRP